MFLTLELKAERVKLKAVEWRVLVLQRRRATCQKSVVLFYKILHFVQDDRVALLNRRRGKVEVMLGFLMRRLILQAENVSLNVVKGLVAKGLTAKGLYLPPSTRS
jgi:hypothetical protein